MSSPSSNPGLRAASETPCGRALTVAELLIVLEELDRVVAALEESLGELALPFDDESHCVARAAIAAARGH